MGPNEEGSSASEFESFRHAQNDVLFLAHVLRSKPYLYEYCRVPDWVTCVCWDKKRVHICNNKKGVDSLSIRSGVFLFKSFKRSFVLVNPSWKREVEKLGRDGVRFVICNLGVYDSETLLDGHSNLLCFDTLERKLERYDSDMKTYYMSEEDALKRAFPGWELCVPSTRKSVTIQEGVDAYGGMCVTFSAMFALYRILNPHLSTSTVYDLVAEGNNLLKKVLRLNKTMADTLRSYKKGSLSKRRRSSHRAQSPA
jgi:hypothetical protein